MIDLLLHGVVDQQAVDDDLVCSARVSLQAQCTIRRLLVDHGIPVRVKHNDFGRSGQVQAKPADLCRHEKNKNVRTVGETLNDSRPI